MAKLTEALFTHHHYGWRKHDISGNADADVLAALLSTHDFLLGYEGRYRTEIIRTPELPKDGRVAVYWDADKPKTDHYGAPLFRGDYWFTLDGFNLADADACKFCGGTGVDHYSPFHFCWACDGTKKQIHASGGRRPKLKRPITPAGRAALKENGR